MYKKDHCLFKTNRPKRMLKMSTTEKFVNASETLKEMASFLSTICGTDLFETLEYLNQLKER